VDARSVLRLGTFACLVPLCAACAEGESTDPPLYTLAGQPAANGGGAGASGASGAAGMTQAGTGGSAGMAQAGSGGGSGNLASQEILPHFSFFVTSRVALQRLSGSESGFGGDLRFGKIDGLSGADEICRQIAEQSLPGAGGKGWRAFLSVTKGASGKAVHARDRIGAGPWYDRNGRLVAANLTDLIQRRPVGAHADIAQDLPNEDGVPNSMPMGTQVDNHRVLTGTGADGLLYNYDPSSTCRNWTSAVGADGRPRVGHAWPRPIVGAVPGGSAGHWISAINEAGCAPGGSLAFGGSSDPSNPTVGSGGGYGGIYCFALMP
jgi:hypothetical protein